MSDGNILVIDLTVTERLQMWGLRRVWYMLKWLLLYKTQQLAPPESLAQMAPRLVQLF